MGPKTVRTIIVEKRHSADNPKVDHGTEKKNGNQKLLWKILEELFVKKN
jgi:hypothetical protein